MGLTLPPEPAYDLDFFKDNSNRWRTKSLFVEFADEPDKYPPIFTIAEEDREIDGKLYISAKRKYLEYMDPTEFTFATKVFGAYPCWEAVCGSPFISPHIEQWRKELEIKLKAEGIQSMYAAMRERDDTTAAKWFAEGRWKETPTAASKRGRPSKQEILRKLSEDARTERMHIEAAKRLGQLD